MKASTLRSWAIRLLGEGHQPPADALARFQALAASGDSPHNRLYLASVLQRLEPGQRWPIAEALSQRAEDASDANLPLMLWYGIEPLIHEDLDRFVALAATTRIPLIARHVGHRVAGLPESREGLDALVRLLAKVDNGVQEELLAGIIEGLEGRRSIDMPAAWPETYATLKEARQETVREQSLQLALIFDDPAALGMLRGLAADKSAPAAARNRAVKALVDKQAAAFAPLLLELASDPATRRSALRGLAEFDHPETPTVILQNYAACDPPARQDALQTLASRPAWAMKLLDAVAAGQVPRSDLSAYTARQLQNLGNADVSQRLKTLWGELRTTPNEKVKLIAGYKKQLTPESLRRADRSSGRAIFQKTCANCHRFFDAGGNIGPDVTGAQRTNLDYLLQTLVDPSAAVAKDFQMQILQTSSGRVITGLVLAENKTAVTIQTVNEKIIVPVDEIEARAVSPLSMMPEGLLQNLPIERLRELLAYLMGPAQVPLPGE